MKETTCALCGRTIVIDDNTVRGQHVLCPYCNRKFSYLCDAAKESPSRKSKVDMKLAIAAGAVASVVVGVALYLVWPSKSGGGEPVSPVRGGASSSQPAAPAVVPGPTPQEEFVKAVEGRIAELRERKRLVRASIAEILGDQHRFASELGSAVERGNLKAAEMQAKGTARLNGAETAMSILKSAFFNEMLARYCGVKPFAKAEECRKKVQGALDSNRSMAQSAMESINQLAISYQEHVAGDVRRGMSEKLFQMRSMQKSIPDAMGRLDSLLESARSSSAAEMAARRAELEEVVRSDAFTHPCQLAPIEKIDAGQSQDSDAFTLAIPQSSAEIAPAPVVVAPTSSPEPKTVAKQESQPGEDAEDESDETAERDEPAEATGAGRKKPSVSDKPSKRGGRRHKCKSPIKCSNFAEPGHNFCTDHECHSYGCKEHVRTLTSANWAHGGLKTLSALSTSERNLIKRKCIGRYCKKHCCNRTCPMIKNYKDWWAGYLYWDNPHTEKFFYCDNERLASTRYCIEHACKVPTCNSCHEEYWKLEDGAKQQEVASEINLDLWWYHWNRKWQLVVSPMCRAHSNTDPESVGPRDVRTPGDVLQAREEK